MVTSRNAQSFDDIIKADRKKRRNEKLASAILGKGRRNNAPADGRGSSGRAPPRAPSLASQIGISKHHGEKSLARKRPIKVPAYTPSSSSFTPKNQSFSTSSRTELDSRKSHHQSLHHHHHRSVNYLHSTRAAEVSRNYPDRHMRDRAFDDVNKLANNGIGDYVNTSRGPSKPPNTNSEISIRGMGSTGPYCVVASNFAPGTTAADIEAVMAPVGGEITNCRLVSGSPTVIAEMLFVDKAGAENVVAMFNNKKADGRLLYVYLKDSMPHSYSKMHSRRPTSPYQQVSDMNMEVDQRASCSQSFGPPSRLHPGIQDGRFGFDSADGDMRNDSRSGWTEHGLFSDNIIARDYNRYNY